MNSEKGHPLLARIPLTKSPFFNPPRPVTLGSSYKQLPAQTHETHISIENLEAWKKEVDHVRSDIMKYGESDKLAYENWLETDVKRVAPGYIGGTNTLLTPQRKGKVVPTTDGSTPEINEPKNDIDRAFSTLNI